MRLIFQQEMHGELRLQRIFAGGIPFSRPGNEIEF